MNILLIQLKRIGDLILTTPAIAAVREKFPRAEITLVISNGTRELLPAIRGVDRALIARGNLRDAANWVTVARRKYEYAIDFTRNDRSAFLTFLSAARKRLTTDHPKQRVKMRALSYNELVDTPIGNVHTVDYHLALLEPLGIHGASQTLRLDIPASKIEEAARVLKDARIAGDFLLLHPGSARAEKFWEAERWAAIIAHAAARNLPVVLTGGNAAMEMEHLSAIKKTARASFVDLSGKLDLLTLAAIIQRARLLVTVDSAPMHFAAALQTPQVVLFGPTNPLHWRPRFAPALILQAGQSAALTDFQPKQKPVPMNQISTEQVIDAIETQLANAPASVS